MVAPITAMANATERAKNATRTSILASLPLVSKGAPEVTLGELPSISSSGAPALLNRNLGSARTALAAVGIWLDARSDLMIGRQLLRLSAPSLSSLRVSLSWRPYSFAWISALCASLSHSPATRSHTSLSSGFLNFSATCRASSARSRYCVASSNM
jgi:hypothetical protein